MIIKRIFSLLLAIFAVIHLAKATTSDPGFYFNAPASIWEESLPLGNGRIGMMPWGGVQRERIVLNEISLWSGEKQDSDNPDAYQYLAGIRSLLFEGKNAEAQALMYKTFTCKGKGSAGRSYGQYQNFGNMYLDFRYPDSAKVTEYKRSINIGQATATTSFTRGEIRYMREYFTSFTHDIGVIRLTADREKAISFDLSLVRDERFKVTQHDQTLEISGQLTGDGVSDNGMRYSGVVKVKIAGGKIVYRPTSISVVMANSAEIRISMATDYWKENPSLQNKNLLSKAEKIPFSQLKKSHTDRYGRLFHRVAIELPKNQHSSLPINERLEAFQKDSTDADLAALYMQYGRYLLISSSRKGSLPANLQGLWAPQVYTPWNGDYHLNINLQMNYWPSETGNLSELNAPLIDYIHSLVKPGERTAKIYYNSRGWVTHILGNVWGFTSPAENPSWGATNTGGAWLCQHLWNHYAYTLDRNYLASVYPILKGSAEFFSDMLVPDPNNGYLVTAPTTSPENAYYTKEGVKVNICAGSTMDNQIVRELFSNTIEAAQILGKDRSLVNELKEKRDRLAPTSIGEYGQIKEWLDDYREVDVHHRHVSQLYALHPGNEITPEKSPALMEAARKTLERRGDQSTGWSMAWKINFWARLKDGNHAAKLIHALFRPARKGQGSYPNLFSAHPPMQIDGNFGGSAGIMEMLVQSHAGYIEFLPALPDHWSHGAVSGLKVRGAGEVSFQWSGGKLTHFTLKATAKSSFVVLLPKGWDATKLKAGNVPFEVKNNKIYLSLNKDQIIPFAQ